MRWMSRSRPGDRVEVGRRQHLGCAVRRRQQVAGPTLEVQLGGAEAAGPGHEHGRRAPDRARAARRGRDDGIRRGGGQRRLHRARLFANHVFIVGALVRAAHLFGPLFWRTLLVKSGSRLAWAGRIGR